MPLDELLDRHIVLAVRQPSQNAGADQADVPRILRSPEGLPLGELGGIEDLRQVARLAPEVFLRRAGATLISSLTPPVAQAGLYRGLVDLKASLERWRALPPEALARYDAGLFSFRIEAV